MPMNFLLPAQTLLDLCASGSNAARRWAETVNTESLRVSVVSIAHAQFFIDLEPDGPSRSQLGRNLKTLVSGITADALDPFAFNADHADVWRTLLQIPSLRDIRPVDMQVYATALHEGLTVVEERNSFSAALVANGVKIHYIEQ